MREVEGELQGTMGEFWVSTGSLLVIILVAAFLVGKNGISLLEERSRVATTRDVVLVTMMKKGEGRTQEQHKASGVSYRQWCVCILPNLCPSREDQNTFRTAGVDGVGWPE